MSNLARSVAPFAAALLFTACPADTEVMSDSTFVHTMSRLHRVDSDERLSREERDTLRTLILTEDEVSAEQLEAKSRSLVDRPNEALQIWQAIERRSREPASAAPSIHPERRRPD